MDYLAGPPLDISFHDQDFDGLPSSPFPADSPDRRSMRFDLGYAEDASTEASSSSSASHRFSLRRDDSRTASDESDAESTDLSSTEECGVFFGKKTEAEKIYLRKLQPGTPMKPSASPSRPSSSPRIVRKRDSREFHRRKTMVFSKKDRFSLSVQAGNEGRGEWSVVAEDGEKEYVTNLESNPPTVTKGREIPAAPSSSPNLIPHNGPHGTRRIKQESLSSTPACSTVQAVIVNAETVPSLTSDAVDIPCQASTKDTAYSADEQEEDSECDNKSEDILSKSFLSPIAVENELERESGMSQLDEGRASDQDSNRPVEAQAQEVEAATQSVSAVVPERTEKMGTSAEQEETHEIPPQSATRLYRVADEMVDAMNSDEMEASSSAQLVRVLTEKLDSLIVGDEEGPSGVYDGRESLPPQLADVNAAADNTADSQPADCTSATLDTDTDSPLPTNRASNFMSPKYHMRGEAYTSPSLWPAGALDRELSVSPLQAITSMQLGGSPLQEEALSASVNVRELQPSSPAKHPAAITQLFVENLLGVSTPRRLAPLNSLTPFKSVTRHAPSPDKLVSAAARATNLLSAPLAPPQARKLQKLPTVANQTVVAGSTRDIARKREITSALDAAVFRLRGKATSSPSPAISRSQPQRKAEPGLSKLKPPQRPLSAFGSTSSKPSMLRPERPHSRQGITADASTTSVALSPRGSAASRQDMRLRPNVTPTLTTQSRLAARQAPVAKQSPTPIPSAGGTPGRLALSSRQVPQASIADVSVTSERPVGTSTLGKAVRPMLSTQARGTSMKASGTIPTLKPISYLPRKQTTTMMMSRNMLPPKAVPVSRPVQISSFGTSTGPSKVLTGMGTQPMRKAVPRVGIAAAAEAARQARATAEPAAAASLVQPSTFHSRAEIRRPSPSTFPPPSSSISLVPPSTDSRASSPHTDDSNANASEQSARAMAGRTPALRREKGAMRSQAVMDTAVDREAAQEQPMEVEANSSPSEGPNGVERLFEAEAVSHAEQSSQSSEPLPSLQSQPHLDLPNNAEPSSSRPVRARQRSLAAQPTTPATLNPRSSSVPPSHLSRFPIADKDLQAVTKRNTMRNEVYFCAITRTVVRRDGPRPPSPTSKIRTVADREEEDRRISREERARRRDRTKSGDDTDDEMGEVEPLVFTKHLRGPGDEEDYETPAKSGKRARKSSAVSSPGTKGVRRKRSRPDVSGKMVRWDKGLVILSDKGETRGSSDGGDGSLKSCIKEEKKMDLDHLGNVPNAQQSLTDLKRSRITVAVICYDGEEPAVPVVPVAAAPAPSSKGKGRA